MPLRRLSAMVLIEGLDNSGLHGLLPKYDQRQIGRHKRHQKLGQTAKWASFGSNILGFGFANDGTGGGAIAALKSRWWNSSSTG